jgi:alpha-beta hydrolase superfamily lysophospholipase
MQPAEVASASIAFAGGGYAVLMPDYLGLGVNQTVHPYPLASINWRSGVDMLPAVTQLATDSRLPLGSQLYVSGYSEGGGVAMWAAKELERQSPKGFRYVSAAPLSGPYDLTGAQMPFMTREIKQPEVLAATVYFLAYVGYSGLKNFGFDLEDFFVPSFASYIPVVFGRSLSDEAYARELMVKAVELGALTSIERLMQAPFFRAMQEEDVDNPLSRLMQQNNCFDWTPKRPLFLFCIENDTLVNPQNTYHAIHAMRARGVNNQTMGFHVASSDLKLSHETAQPSAVALARRFFDVGLARVPTTELPASANPGEGSKEGTSSL